MKLLLLRHGQCHSNLENRFQGQVDSPLTDIGRAQALAAAERLRQEPIAAIYSSDLIRARDTAAPVAARLQLPVTLTPLLRECDIGDVQGMTREEFREHSPEACALWESDPIRHRPPGAERYEDVIARCAEFIGQVTAAHQPGDLILAAVHVGSLSGLICAALNLPTRAVLKFRAANCSLSLLELVPEPALHVLNDCSHLPQS